MGARTIQAVLGVVLYVASLLAFTYGARLAQRAHGTPFVDMKREVPGGIALRAVCSVFYYAAVIEWAFGLRLLPWTYLPLPSWANWVGLVGFAAVTAFFWWVAVTLGSSYHGPLLLHDGHQLVTTGPYALVRHPTYTAFAIMHLSLTLLTSSWLLGVSGLVMSTYVNVRRIRVEEGMLPARFGDRYAGYAARVGQWLPGIGMRRLHGSAAPPAGDGGSGAAGS